MATIIINGAAVEGCCATTNNSASSYGQPVWAGPDGTAYAQVGLPNPLCTVELDAEAQRTFLGQQIRNLRLKLGLSIENLSKATGIDASNISKLERGGTATSETLGKIASAMGASLGLIL